MLGLPADQSCGQPTWTPEGAGLVFTAWPHAQLNFPATNRRLGVVHCFSRPCSLFFVPCVAPPPAQAPVQTAGDSTGSAAGAAASAEASTSALPSHAVEAVNLSPGLLSAGTPLFTPDGSQLLLLSHEAAATSGVHNATAALLALDWPQVGVAWAMKGAG